MRTSTRGGYWNASSREIAQELEETRKEIDHTLHALQERLSPARMLQRARSTIARDGRRWRDAVVRTASENPLPVLVVGVGVVGLAWAAIRGAQSRRR